MTAPTNAEIDESLFFLEQLARDHHNDGAPETALYINRAATMLRALRDQREADAITGYEVGLTSADRNPEPLGNMYDVVPSKKPEHA